MESLFEGVKEDKAKSVKEYLHCLEILGLEEKVKIYLTKTYISLAKKCVQEDRRMIVIRGIPGSGKTTFAKHLMQIFWIMYDIFVFIAEADSFMGSTFSVSRLQYCHNLCKENAKVALQGGGFVIVSNTSTTKAEVQPYINMAVDGKTGFIVAEPVTPWKRSIEGCMEKCTKKGIPKHIFEKHLNNMESKK